LPGAGAGSAAGGAHVAGRVHDSGMRRAVSRSLAAMLVLLLAGMLSSCDVGGQQTNNNFQKVSNSIP